MARQDDDRLLVICGYLAAIAAAIIVVSMQVPTAETTFTSVLAGARFVGAVAATVFGVIVWFERRFPIEDEVLDLRVDLADVETSAPARS